MSLIWLILLFNVFVIHYQYVLLRMFENMVPLSDGMIIIICLYVAQFPCKLKALHIKKNMSATKMNWAKLLRTK